MNKQQLTDMDNITIGISACVHGENVRFDASSKPSQFCTKELSEYVKYQPICPEVAIGLPVPRKTIRQINKNDVIHVARPDGSGDVTEALSAYGKKIAEIAKNFSGFIFCAKSPSCGMERVKVYDEAGKGSVSTGVGLFAAEIMKANPLLPCEENGRLNDAVIRENFVARIYAYRMWQSLSKRPITKHKLMEFHTKFKYTVMSHDLVAYKKLGQLLARADLAVDEMAAEYISGLMAALKTKATRKKHTNTLQHIQGYFSNELSSMEKQELAGQIDDYRKGLVPLFAPLTLIKHHLMRFPKAYLEKQFYLSPHPAELKLRYSL